MKTVLGLSLLVAVAAGCGGGHDRPALFSTDWLDDQGKSIAEVQARLRGVRPLANADLAVGVAGNDADKLIGVPLDGGAQWTFPHKLDARPVIAGGVVIGSGSGEVFALDARNGKRLWARPTGGLQILGAGDDGNVTAVSFSRGNGSTVLIVARDGAVRRQIETDKQVGVPAVLGGVVFVPWSNQYVSAIDAASGDELGRVVVRDKVSRALTIGGAMYFGELAFVRFDDKIATASRGGANRIGIPSRELPGTPRLLVPGSEKESAIANARDRDRLFARPSSPDGPLGIDSNRFYATYFKLVFGFDTAGGKLAWVHTHGSDVLGGQAVTSGILLCDELGKITILDARTGQVSTEKSFGEPIKSCVAHADSFRALPSGSPGKTLAQQVGEAAQLRDPSLATAQRLLLRELATMEDESATQSLVDIASDPRSAPILVQDARAGIATRRNGAQYMLAALAKHYDFLHDVLVSPPVGPCADALAAMKEPKAAPLLAAHLLDDADNDDDVRRAAKALAVLGTKAELPHLKHFVSAYRGTAESEDVANAVGSVAEAILRLDGKEGRAFVEAAAKDSMTVPVAKTRLEAILSAMPAEKEKAPEPAPKK